VPAGTQRGIVEHLNRQVAKILSLPDVREHLAMIGFEPINGTPEQFAAYINAEAAEWGRVVQAAHIRID
jgi:tripartite-type tricarboxylate transporter receptor subunit TctC